MNSQPVKFPKPELWFSELPGAFDCPICSAPSAVRFASAYPSVKRRFKLAIILFCAECGSGHVPDADRLIKGYYETEYGSDSRFKRDIDPALFFSDLTAPKLRTYVERARAQVQELQSVGAVFDKVLDFGAGQGVFLHVANATAPFAAELDPECHKYLHYLGVQIVPVERPPQNAFDVVVASHVVEHFTATRLQSSLEQIVDTLKPGGFGLIEVPHGGLSYVHKARYQEPHTLFFTPAGLIAAIERAGAEIVYTGTKGAGDIPARKNAIYVPPDDKFLATKHEGLTVVFRRP